MSPEGTSQASTERVGARGDHETKATLGAQGDRHPLSGSIGDRGWIELAICGDHAELFFGAFGERPGARAVRERKARAICARCPVRLECREAGRRNHENGIWGGETEEDRARAGYPPRSINRREVASARHVGIRRGGEEQARGSEVAWAP